MTYLVIGISFIIALIPILILRFLKPNKLALCDRILTYLLIAVFLVRYFSYKCNLMNIIDYTNMANKPYSDFVGITSGLLTWFSNASLLFIMMRSFYSLPFVKRIVKFICPVFILLTIGFINPTIGLLQGSEDFTLLSIFYGMELGLALALCIRYWLDDLEIKINWKACLTFIGVYFVLSIAIMPTYMLQFLFGYINGFSRILDFTPLHRYFLYFAVIIPFTIYFVLHKMPEKVVWFSLTYITVGTLINFTTNYDYTMFMEPWRWPFHLCNTAMFILPFCIVFKAKRFFYFSIFLNVAGAFIALLLPDYPDASNIFSTRIVQYWYNHYIAFFMPILFIALKIFPRPKFKQFWYSVIFFTGYYLIIMVLNPYFTAIGHKCDFFFINSDFVAKKFGQWAKDLFHKTASITIGDVTLVYHPMYQLGYYLSYIAISLATWFIYTLGYDIADRLGAMHQKLVYKHNEQVKLKLALDGRDIKQPLYPNEGIKIELKDFSKKYASSDRFAVKGANLVVNGGEIFGFLGPNGAGKSTIIKAIVGIHGITSGNISICGFDRERQDLQAKELIGFVPDHYALYETLTGREYLNYIADIYKVNKKDRKERMNKYLTLFEMENNIDSMIKTYSHGMKQKITIMAALIHNPKVWILDEPLTGLDPNSIYQVKECMKQHASEGNVVFFSSHIIDVVEKLCQRIAIIKHGHIQCVKSVDEIENSGTTLEQFYLDIVGDNKDEE